ncbi:hypothetical protein ACTZWW_11785 [Salinarimonas sp. NSM]|uniref:hypothetical protein n=1 Tax=Salinarimonas sp. NSM TaxID=3458003 RepID=UPI00403665CB
MGKELHVSDETFELARRIAEGADRSVDAVLADALRRVVPDRRAAEEPPRRDARMPTPEAIAARRAALRALQAEIARMKPPGTTSDHSDMYDESGLPR